MIYIKKNEHQKGQILLIVILTMVVALTVGLSVASRSITNVKVSKQSEESQRAFQAAEAGIDQALGQIKANGASQNSIKQFQNNANYDVKVNSTSGPTIAVNNGEPVEQNVGFDVWLSSYPNYTAPFYTGNITLYWGTANQNKSDGCDPGSGLNAPNPDSTPALEVLVLTQASPPKLEKHVYDPCTSINNRTTSASGATEGNMKLGGITYRFRANSFAISNGLIMKIIPLYNSTTIGVSGSVPLPKQGVIISSTGKSGDAVRKLQYFVAYPQIPNELFPYSIVSQ